MLKTIWNLVITTTIVIITIINAFLSRRKLIILDAVAELVMSLLCDIVVRSKM